MANSILTIDMITRKALEILENNLVLTRNVNRQYDDSFAVEGAKIGSTLRIRLPDRALVTDGAALQVQSDNEQYTTLSVASQKHIGVNFTSAELTMQLDDFAERVLKPRISQLAASIDADVANSFLSIGNSVGTPGTTPATSLVLLQAQQKLNENAAVMSPRYATVNPAANAGLVEGMKGLFNPTDTISRQFKNGMMGMGVLGFDEVNMSQSIKQFTCGTRNATGGTTSAAVTSEGATSIAITGAGANATVKIGDVFTVAGCYAVNPQTRESTGSLQQFTVLADATATTGITQGVFGGNHSTSGVAVAGYATAASGTTYGVYGRTASPDGFAVYARGRLKVTDRSYLATPATAPNDIDLNNGSISFYLTEGTNKQTLNVRVKTSGGALKTATIALA